MALEKGLRVLGSMVTLTLYLTRIEELEKQGKEKKSQNDISGSEWNFTQKDQSLSLSLITYYLGNSKLVI